MDETFLVVNGDVITDLDVQAVIDFHNNRAGKAEATITLTPVDDPSPFGVVPTDDDGRVLDFIEKPAPGTAPTNLINAGTYVLEPSVLGRIPKGTLASTIRVAPVASRPITSSCERRYRRPNCPTKPALMTAPMVAGSRIV